MPDEIILVVDDEPVVLNSVAAILQFAGFTVLRAASPQEALHIGLSHLQPIVLMVCDVLMPGLSGPRMADEFGMLHPETQFLFMAGLPDHPEVRERVDSGDGFLAKPFLPKELLAKVRQILGPGADPVHECRSVAAPQSSLPESRLAVRQETRAMPTSTIEKG